MFEITDQMWFHITEIILLYTVIKPMSISIALQIYFILIKIPRLLEEHRYCRNRMFIIFKFPQLKSFYSAITGYFVHIRDLMKRRQFYYFCDACVVSAQERPLASRMNYTLITLRVYSV